MKWFYAHGFVSQERENLISRCCTNLRDLPDAMLFAWGDKMIVRAVSVRIRRADVVHDRRFDDAEMGLGGPQIFWFPQARRGNQ
ncbi:MAG TPA: hypothetical protein PKN13_03325 [Accumulibacter sp.]|nr:hypothetical protein [Accumulibacter sp.]HMW17268.1 hypothetical protein [Accumulibacter sp.]HMX21596.1 hypothetical protein [Accumulibacter sp.]HMY05578.1 hypothetical protein [Accumulibacter sp.]HNC17838.1 hypothetical protein [Accumulibacter sp.]